MAGTAKQSWGWTEDHMNQLAVDHFYGVVLEDHRYPGVEEFYKVPRDAKDVASYLLAQWQILDNQGLFQQYLPAPEVDNAKNPVVSKLQQQDIVWKEFCGKLADGHLQIAEPALPIKSDQYNTRRMELALDYEEQMQNHTLGYAFGQMGFDCLALEPKELTTTVWPTVEMQMDGDYEDIYFVPSPEAWRDFLEEQGDAKLTTEQKDWVNDAILNEWSRLRDIKDCITEAQANGTTIADSPQYLNLYYEKELTLDEALNYEENREQFLEDVSDVMLSHTGVVNKATQNLIGLELQQRYRAKYKQQLDNIAERNTTDHRRPLGTDIDYSKSPVHVISKEPAQLQRDGKPLRRRVTQMDSGDFKVEDEHGTRRVRNLDYVDWNEADVDSDGMEF